ncbi:hypothetical protein [Chlamydia caviae]|uniref:Uncharacterized protein n=1 Tax=Chlamydia caviae (strain ATCC VR-813 / DSM 19441 / 03DC25 / GPIC) TaxID=227941 RepID=Q823J3_CHLCV|nr:hypothetical protein [Chlamydia caviae]AAP05163.1 conserved hypothetical protein [Chlamydia caviae GPIC]
MKDKIDNNESEELSLINAARKQTKAGPDPALFTVTTTSITSTKAINMNNQNITGLPEPRNDSDAVSLDYLKSNYVSKSDPLSGYLATTGGSMTGNIDMSGHSIINISMPTTQGSTDLNPSAAATVKYVMDTANTVTNNSQINDAVQKITEVSAKVTTIEEALGMKSDDDDADDPDAPPPPDTSLFVKIEGSTMSGNLDMSLHTVTGLKTPSDSDTKDAANVEYVQSKITTPQIGLLGNTISTQTTVTGEFDWKTAPTPPTPVPPAPPAPAPQPSPTPAVPTPSLPQPSLPKRIKMGSDITAASPTTTTTPKTTPTPTTTPPTTTPTTTDVIVTTPVTDQYLKIEDSDTKTIKVLAPGILTLSVTANWSGGTNANISVILNPSTPAGGGSGSAGGGSSSGGGSGGTPSNGSGGGTSPSAPTSVRSSSNSSSSSSGNTSTTTDTTVYTVSALSSGQNLFCQIPVEKPSDLKLKFNPPTTGSSNTGNDLTVTSWSWQVTLLPSTFATTTTPPSP